MLMPCLHLQKTLQLGCCSERQLHLHLGLLHAVTRKIFLCESWRQSDKNTTTASDDTSSFGNISHRQKILSFSCRLCLLNVADTQICFDMLHVPCFDCLMAMWHILWCVCLISRRYPPSRKIAMLLFATFTWIINKNHCPHRKLGPEASIPHLPTNGSHTICWGENNHKTENDPHEIRGVCSEGRRTASKECAQLFRDGLPAISKKRHTDSSFIQGQVLLWEEYRHTKHKPHALVIKQCWHPVVWGQG